MASVYEVKCYNLTFRPKWKTPIQLLAQLLYLLANIKNSKWIVCQLAGYHSFLPVLLSKITHTPSLVIAGGTDCHSFPSIGYGNFQKPFLRYFTQFTFKNCTHISPKHQSLILTKYNYDKADFPYQGINFFVKNLSNKFTVIHNGFDSNLFARIKPKTKNTFITVSGNLDYGFQIKLKGIDLILEVAQDFPQCQFTIVGFPHNYQKPAASKNVIFLPPVANHKLVELFSSSEYYFQLSMAEGFPNAMCEAMLCECVPIGSNVFSIPEIIGESGYILKERSTHQLKSLLTDIISKDNSQKGAAARQFILKNYPIELRKNLLLNLLKQNYSPEY